ncbi:MAG: DUF4364 family protein [Clostridiales bacterium]|nr:DUF4364 family protein [Clostridiales bacterium]
MKMTLQNPEEIKIFILYLLDRIGYPLSYSDLGAVVIRDGIIDYFAYFEYFCELVESGHIAEADEDGGTVVDNSAMPGEQGAGKSVSDTLNGEAKYPRPTGEDLSDGSKKYAVTKTGRLIARTLSENILMASIREKSYISAMRHLSLEKRGAVCDQTFSRDGDKFTFNCTIKDKEGTALDLSLRADNVYQLNRMRLSFDERPDVILRGVVALLTGNVDYLFEE